MTGWSPVQGSLSHANEQAYKPRKWTTAHLKAVQKLLHKKTEGILVSACRVSASHLLTNLGISATNGDFFFSVAQHFPVGQCLFFIEASRSHSDTPHSVGLLNEWSVQRRYLYLTKRDTHKTDIHNPGGIRTSKRAAADLRLKPRGQWDNHKWFINNIIKYNIIQHNII